MELLESKVWTFAKTMPTNPHFWSLRTAWGSDAAHFNEVVDHIRTQGEAEIYGKTKYRVFHANGWKYWQMNERTEITRLINRCLSKYDAPYDALADDYDAMFQAPADRQEDADVLAMIDRTPGTMPFRRVLDIGCGSGAFLDMATAWARLLRSTNGVVEYVGIDPSKAMLDRLQAKHPTTMVHRSKFEHFVGGDFDLVVGIYGAPSYVDPKAWAGLRDVLAPGGRFFLMFYSPHYRPRTHAKLVAPPKVHPVVGSFPGLASELIEWGNYVIVKGYRP